MNGRLPHENFDYDYALDDYEVEKVLIHLYDTFCYESIRLLGRVARCRTNILYHLLKKIGKEPNIDHFQFMKGPAHQRTEEEIEFIFGHLGWNYSPLCGVQGPPVPAPALASKVSLSPSTCNL